MVDKDPFDTQRDGGPDLSAELRDAGFENAEVIGRGGFAVVYRCTQVGLDRTVAVKTLSEEFDRDNRARFLREQRAMGRLTGHPNIVGVLQTGQTASGFPYLVMQYHAQGSLDARIRRDGPLSVEEVLRIGVKLAAALETAHQAGIVHRDVKPANTLFTDYGEPALTDFGIAHFAGGFRTATGTVTGSPAFVAPEVLSGDPPTPAADVYGLGATLFCALTGHAAFERRSGEQVVAQFLRVTSQPVPDLRESGIPDDVCAVVETTMSRDPRARPSAETLEDELRRIQRSHNLPVDRIMVRTGGESERQSVTPAARVAAGAESEPKVTSSRGNLSIEMTNFVGRRTELSEVRSALKTTRLVTLTGVGGVGKTRLALRAAATMQRVFPDGVWLVELGELRDPALVADLVAATLEVRDRQSARPLYEVLNEFLAPRKILLVIDNCEQVVAAVADLAHDLLPKCPDLRILATSREPIGIAGESVLRVPPLTTPEPDHTPSLRNASRFDAVTLFTARAALALPGFELTAETNGIVSQICARLDGLPLAIELAAARLRTLSLEQILQRLTDRYALLSRGSRSAPTRQQTLRWSIGWSYDLCTPAEQELWGRLTVFAGSFELDAAEEVCGGDGVQQDVLDAVSALVDKSILIREDAHGAVRFRMLDTVRDFGREKFESAGLYANFRRRHRDWYLQLALDSSREWISPGQPEWVARLGRELPNLRGALEFSLSEQDGVALRIAAALNPFWISRGLFCEGRRWLDRSLAQPRHQSVTEQARALHAVIELALLQGDSVAAAPRVQEARALDAPRSAPAAYAFVAAAEGFDAFVSGDLDHARTRLEEAVESFDDHIELTLQIDVFGLLGWTHNSMGRNDIAVTYHEKALDITESHGESIYRSYALWSMGVTLWCLGDSDRAVRLLEDALRLTQLAGPPIMTATCLQALAWIVAEQHKPRRAAVMAGAADAVSDALSRPLVFPNLSVYAEQFEHSARRQLGNRSFEAAYREGRAMDVNNAIAFALGERVDAKFSSAHASTDLTKRERQVAELIAEGLTNRAIAARLVLSQRTVGGHVEHVLAKLGFTSRAQIAAWIVEQNQPQRGQPPTAGPPGN